ncbi:SDR family oxidoreductase [Bacillus toyonensis]|uniref:SDR family oxidoreductase n=1 Tax=Bacillus toyonensis TaxID=155322 RepID=UPI0030148828
MVKGTALKFSQKGDQVVIADFNAELGNATAIAIHENDGEAIFMKTEVSKFKEVELLIEKTVQTFGRIDIMFNNVGIGYPSPVLDQDLNDYHCIININQHDLCFWFSSINKYLCLTRFRGCCYYDDKISYFRIN